MLIGVGLFLVEATVAYTVSYLVGVRVTQALLRKARKEALR